MSGHERAHARFSPSQAERFLTCPGSTKLIESVAARETSEYAILGTKAHDVLEKALTNRERSAVVAHAEYSVYCFETFSDEFFDAIQMALNYVYDILDENPDAILYVETQVNPPNQNAKGDASGYCDIAIHIPSLRVLYVIDYKHGVGVAKDPRTPQIRQYALGFLYDENALVDPTTIDHVHMVVIQPRYYRPDGLIREITCSPYEVYEYLDVLENGIVQCLRADAQLNPGEHCHSTFCPARTVCPAREAAAVAAVNTQFKNIRHIDLTTLPPADTLDIERLSYIKGAGELLKEWLEDVDRHVYTLLQQGVYVPGWKLVETDARRQWEGDENIIAQQLAGLSGKSVLDFLRTQLITITDAEKIVTTEFRARAGKGKAKEAAQDAKKAMAQFTLKKSSGALKVVPEDDPAPAVNRADVFKAANIAGTLPPQQ